MVFNNINSFTFSFRLFVQLRRFFRCNKFPWRKKKDKIPLKKHQSNSVLARYLERIERCKLLLVNWHWLNECVKCNLYNYWGNNGIYLKLKLQLPCKNYFPELVMRKTEIYDKFNILWIHLSSFENKQSANVTHIFKDSSPIQLHKEDFFLHSLFASRILNVCSCYFPLWCNHSLRQRQVDVVNTIK